MEGEAMRSTVRKVYRCFNCNRDFFTLEHFTPRRKWRGCEAVEGYRCQDCGQWYQKAGAAELHVCKWRIGRAAAEVCEA